MPPITRFVRRHGRLTFLAPAFGPAWLLQPLLFTQGGDLAARPVAVLHLLLITMTPAAAAVLTPAGLRDLAASAALRRRLSARPAPAAGRADAARPLAR
jgi:hypothetical protein